MQQKMKSILAIVATAFLVLIVYIFLHESGHAITALICGAQITRLSILEAHTWWSGGDFTAFTLSLCYAAGVLLPIGISFIIILFFKKDLKNPIYRLAAPSFIAVSTATAIVWVVLPLVSLFSPLPNTDDVTKFLQSSGLPPAVVSLVSAVLMLSLILLSKRKGISQSLISAIKSLAFPEANNDIFLSKKELCALAAAALTAIFATLLLELPAHRYGPSLVSVISSDLADETSLEKSFDVQQAGEYHFDLQIEAEGILTDIRIFDSEQNLLYQTLAENASSNGTIYLNEGTCKLSVTYLTSSTAFRQYCKDVNAQFDEAAIRELASVFEQEAQTPRLSFAIKP